MEEEFGVDTTGVNPGTEIGQSESLTPYVGPYVTEMLGRGQALASIPYEAYMGPLTAGASDLQTTAFEGIGSLNIPTDTMGAFTPSTISSSGPSTIGGISGLTLGDSGQQPFSPVQGGQRLYGGAGMEYMADLEAKGYIEPSVKGMPGLYLEGGTQGGPKLTPEGIAAGLTLADINAESTRLSDAEMAKFKELDDAEAARIKSLYDTGLPTQTNTNIQNYMNPYLMSALQPQIDEARRQSDIERQRAASRLTQAGAFGGGRQAIMDAENQRNLLQNLAGITGAGYRDAYDKAVGQFNVEQDRARGVQQDINRYGLEALGAQLGAGDIQRNIEQQGITADRLQFEEEKMDPFKKVQYMQSLLDGLPLETVSKTYAQPTGFEQLRGDFSDITGLLTGLFGPQGVFK